MRDWIIGTLGGVGLIAFFLLVAKIVLPFMEAIRGQA
jgi:hypothetical protein